MCAFLKHRAVADRYSLYDLACNTHHHMHSLKLEISVNVFPHCFKKKEWLVGRFGWLSSCSRLYPVQKYLIPRGFDIDLIKTDTYELK